MNFLTTHAGQTRHPSREAGFSLVELLVAVTIGLVVTLAMFGVLSTSEGRKRTATSVNDTNQSGMFASYLLDRAIRNAGSGYAQRWDETGACRLNVERTNVAVWPRAAALPAPFEALPAPFAALPMDLRLVPLVIVKNGTANSDAIITMAGTAGFGESPIRLQNGAATSTSVSLDNTIGIRGGDLLAVSDGDVCLLEQVTAGFVGGAVKLVGFTGTYATPQGNYKDLDDFGTVGTAYGFALGNATTNPPRFEIFGIGDNDTLFNLDLLRINGQDEPAPLADGIAEMRAVYGVDTNADGRLDTWVDPGTAPWDAVTLLNGTAASRDNLKRITAVRVALVLRGSLVEKADVAPDELKMFSDLGVGLEQTRAIAAADRTRRHRVVEMTVPLRNLLLREP